MVLPVEYCAKLNYSIYHRQLVDSISKYPTMGIKCIQLEYLIRLCVRELNDQVN